MLGSVVQTPVCYFFFYIACVHSKGFNITSDTSFLKRVGGPVEDSVTPDVGVPGSNPTVFFFFYIACVHSKGFN